MVGHKLLKTILSTCVIQIHQGLKTSISSTPRDDKQNGQESSICSLTRHNRKGMGRKRIKAPSNPTETTVPDTTGTTRAESSSIFQQVRYVVLLWSNFQIGTVDIRSSANLDVNIRQDMRGTTACRLTIMTNVCIYESFKRFLCFYNWSQSCTLPKALRLFVSSRINMWNLNKLTAHHTPPTWNIKLKSGSSSWT